MAVLVVGEHDGAGLKPATLSAVTAAGQIGAKVAGGVAVLVAGSGCGAVAAAAAKVAGVERVLLADDPLYGHPLAENLAKLVVSVAGPFSHLLAGADSFGKNIMPRVAALIDVAQVSDIVAIEGPKVFVRPIYAGNALQTVEATDPKVVVTVRGTAFEPAAKGAAGQVEKITVPSEIQGKVKFVKLNTDDNVDTAAKYGIRSIPTLLVFKAGEAVEQVIGFRPKGDLKRVLDKSLS